jgi:hypothetical protein
MSEGLLAFVTVAVVTGIRELPRIIWAIRCPADSEHYSCPRAGGSIGALARRIVSRRQGRARLS